jgi:DegV family protein with EDD domain
MEQAPHPDIIASTGLSHKEACVPKIALVTDSTCDLPEVERSRYKPTVVPLHFTLDGVSYLDRVDMDSDIFYKRFRESGQVAHSSQPSVGEFVNTYSALLADYEAVVSVHISSRLSGAVQSASVAAEAVDSSRVRVVDSRHVSVGLGLVVQAAGEAVQAGAELDSVVAVAEAAARATRVYGALPDLEVAVKGGRVSAPAAMIAGLMEIKPLIVFDEEGATRIAGARLGYRRALQAVADKVVRYAAGSPVRVVIVHADGPESAQSVKEHLGAALGDIDIPVVQAGAVITSHVGLGTVAVGVRRLPAAAETAGATLGS